MEALIVLLDWVVFFVLLQALGWYFYFRFEAPTYPHHHKRGKPTLEIDPIPEPRLRA